MTVLPVPPAVGEHSAVRLRSLALGVRRELARRGLDYAPIVALAHVLRTSPDSIRAAATRDPVLGLCGPAVFCVPPQPLAMGFRPELRGGRLALRLPVRHRPDLWVTGHRLGPMPANELDGAHDKLALFGRGELAHTIARLTLMARDWLLPGEDPTRQLFELIATAWLLGRRPKRIDTLGILRVDFEVPIARENDRPTSRLELVVNVEDGTHQLVNVYPFSGGG